MAFADASMKEQSGWHRLDPLGVLIALVTVAGLSLPFAVFKANRIVPGDGLSLWQALPTWAATIALIAIGIVLASAVFRLPSRIKLITSAVGLISIALFVGLAAISLTPSDNVYARTGIGGGFWLIAFAFVLMLTDALSRLRPAPWTRIGLLLVSGLLLFGFLWSGAWNELSILKEYASQEPVFWREARTHLSLAFGSVLLAMLIGVPIGIACYKITPLRAGALNVLNVVQTIPSIALFGIMIAPLGWIAANVPGASAIGVSGIGTAPAMVALVAYALLPIVANTLVGLTGLPDATVEAARGMGMTWRQRLWRVELPLAFPVVLTGVRIVLVQNIGLATIAALIGGGGFGVFVFQGIGQTAIDLVLLGAVPTVVLAFAAAVLLDSFVELASTRGQA